MTSNPSTAPILFDRLLLLKRLERARKQGAVTFLFDRVAEDIGDRLQAVMRKFSDVADVWSPGELLPKPLSERFASITRLAFDSESEKLPLEPESLDLAVSALALHFVNDLPGVLAQIRRALRPDGLLLAAMLGGDTLTELKQSFAAAEAECEGGVSPRVAPFADLRDVGALLQRAGFALPVTDVDRVVVRYDSALSTGAARRPAAPPCCGWRKSTASDLPIPTAASAPPSISSGCPAGRRMRASQSRSSPVRRKRAWRRR